MVGEKIKECVGICNSGTWNNDEELWDGSDSMRCTNSDKFLVH